MLIYITLFFIVLVWACAEDRMPNRKVAGLAIVFVGLGVFVGVSDMLGGYDRYIYAELFDGFCDDTAFGIEKESTSLWELYASEWGYCELNVIASYFTRNRYIFILFITILIYLLAFNALRRTTKNPAMATLLFLGLNFFFTFTYLRQVLAVMVVWNAYPYIAERKALKFFALMFIAYSLHNSAIVFAPMYFIPVRKYPPIVVIIVAMVCLGLGVTSLPSTVFEIYGEVAEAQMRVEEYVDDLSESGVLRIEYFLEAVFFLGILLTQYKHVGNSKKEVVMLNSAIVFCCILLVFIRSLNGGRLSWTYMLGVIVTLTTIASSKESIALYRYGLMAFSFALFFRILVSWGTMIAPYKTFFTNGVRPNDRIHELYEYNHEYDNDKFCR